MLRTLGIKGAGDEGGGLVGADSRGVLAAYLALLRR
jgi:hypothetical protein